MIPKESKSFFLSSTNLWFVSALIMIISVLEIKSIPFVHLSENYFSNDLQEISSEKEYKERYSCQGEDELILAVLYSNDGIFNIPFLNKLREISDKTLKIKGVAEVSSLTHSNYFSFENEDLSVRPIVNVEQKVNLVSDSAKLEEFQDLQKRLITHSRKGTIVGIFPNNDDSKNSMKDIIMEIRKIIEKAGLQQYQLAGFPVVQNAFEDEAKMNLKNYTLIAALIALIILFLLFRKWLHVAVLFAIVCLPITLLILMIRMLGLTFDLIMINAIPLLLVLSLSGVIHFLMRFQLYRSVSSDLIIVYKQTRKEMILPIWITGLTTAIGFISLTGFNITSLSNFGMICGLFAGSSIFLQFILLRQLLCNSPVGFIIGVSDTFQSFTNNLITFNSKNKWKNKFIWIGTIILILLSVNYSLKINVNGNIIDEFDKNHPLRKSIEQLDQDLQGTRQVELELKTIKQQSISIQHYQKITEFEKLIEDSAGLSQILSPVSFIKACNRTIHGNHKEFYKLPVRQGETDSIISLIEQSPFAGHWDCYHSANNGAIKLTGQWMSQDLITNNQKRNIIKRLFANCKADSVFTLDFHGMEYLSDLTAQDMGNKLPMNILTTLVAIFLLLLMFWRSVTLGFIALLPVMISMLAMSGVMGYLGIPIKPDTAFLFSVLSGIAVDNSVHLLHHAQSKGWKTMQVDEFNLTMKSITKSLLIHSMIICAGFGCLLFSDFKSAFHFGLLGFTCMAVSFFINISIIPTILSYIRYSKEIQ